MGTIKNAVYKVDNGTDFDEIHFKTKAEQVICSNGKTAEVQLAEKANNTDSARTTTAKDVTGALNELNAGKLNNSTIEEGVWTPVLYSTSGGQTLQYARRLGRYIKIGDMVICDFYIKLSNKPSDFGGTCLIKGFPYQINKSKTEEGYITYYNGVSKATTWYNLGFKPHETATIAFWITKDSLANLAGAEVTTIFEIHGQLVFYI